MQKIDVKKIIPDDNQPRKYFAENKMATLKASIKKHGIMNPLIVEVQKDGTYILIDGERRFRSAKDLGLKEVPVIVVKSQNKIDRLIQQFHIQEQHEGWTSAEKAIAISTLAEEMDIPALEVCRLLGIPVKTAEKYLAFSRIIDKKNFQRNNMPISYAQPIGGLKTYAKNIVQNELEEVFSQIDEKNLENAVVRSFANGSITKERDIAKLKDAFRKDPKTVQKFIEDKDATPDSLFVESKATGAFHLRNIRQNATYLESHLKAFMRIGDVKPEEITIQALKRLLPDIKRFLHMIGDEE